jgi:hypothetical protein
LRQKEVPLPGDGNGDKVGEADEPAGGWTVAPAKPICEARALAVGATASVAVDEA